jgi:hypothetical protein
VHYNPDLTVTKALFLATIFQYGLACKATVRSNMVHSHCFDFANPVYLVPLIASSDLRIGPKYYLLAIQLFSRALSMQNCIHVYTCSFCFRAKRSSLAPFTLNQSNMIKANASIRTNAVNRSNQPTENFRCIRKDIPGLTRLYFPFNWNWGHSISHFEHHYKISFTSISFTFTLQSALFRILFRIPRILHAVSWWTNLLLALLYPVRIVIILQNPRKQLQFLSKLLTIQTFSEIAKQLHWNHFYVETT